MEKATTALETSHRRRIEAMMENHRKDLSDLRQQLRKDAQTERKTQAEIYRKELRELRELLSNQTLGRKPTAKPPQPSPKPSQFTALKAPEQPQV
jgi:Spy/CpxP family protein refolding chaperone